MKKIKKITNVTFTPSADWAKKLPLFKSGSFTIDFSPTLNVLFGPNGCGKSSLIYALIGSKGKSIYKDKYTDILTNSNVNQNDLVLFDGIYDSGQQMTAMDEAFDSIGGLSLWMAKKTMSNGLRVLNTFASFMESKLHWLECTAGKKVDMPIVFLDEPDISLSLDTQNVLWKLIHLISTKTQVIVASHSPMVFAKDCNLIELEPGFVQKSKDLINKLALDISKKGTIRY